VVASTGSTIQADIVTTATYPLAAIVLSPNGQGGLRVRRLRGLHVHGLGTGDGAPNAYRYTFTTGIYRGSGYRSYQGRSYALLIFTISRRAPLETVLMPIVARGPDGCVSTLVGANAPHFRVVRDAASPRDDGRLLATTNGPLSRYGPAHMSKLVAVNAIP
jgi:hypothetical protein